MVHVLQSQKQPMITRESKRCSKPPRPMVDNSQYQSVIQFYVAIHKHKANFVNSVSSWFVFINCIQWTYRSFAWVRNAGSYVCQSHHSNCTVKLLSLQVCWNSRCSWRDGITTHWTYNTGKNPASSNGDCKVKLLKKKQDSLLLTKY